MKTHSTIEPLEARIAPASLTFTDVDGDRVVITTSGAGTLVLGGNVSVTNGQLEFLDLTDAAFQGANVSIVATRDPIAGGDGRVNVGNISASGRDLGAVKVDGDLGLLVAGSGADPARGVASLSVASLGRMGKDTGAIFVIVNVAGKLGSLTVQGDVVGTEIAATTIGSVTIAGSLLGGPTDRDGSIVATGNVGAVKIGHDIVGGGGDASGVIRAGGAIASVTLGGSLLGGANPTGLADAGSGVIDAAGALGPVKIGGDVRGGASSRFAGRIFSDTKIASVTVGGSLMGGLFDNSGLIHTDGKLGAVKIAHDILGGGSFFTGQILGATGIGVVTVGGSLRSDTGGSRGEIRSAGGDIGAVKIAGDIAGGAIYANGALAGVTLGGSLVGGSAFDTGKIFSGGAMGTVKIGGDIRGDSTRSGQVLSDTSLGNVTLGGSLLGGAGEESGRIFSMNSIGKVTIGENIVGGAGVRSGLVFAQDDLAGVSLGGSLRGGPAGVTGTLLAGGAIGPVKIGGDILGGDLNGAVDLDSSGSIQGKHIVSVFVGGSIRPGVDAGAGKLIRNGTIRANDDLGQVTIKGSLIGTAHADGNSADGDFTPAIIAARGQETPSATSDVAIKSVTIGGRVEQAQIVAGYTSTQFLTGTNGDAQIGAVKIGGDWIASRLVAGTDSGGDNIPGSADDTFLGGGSAAIVSKIASITIKGQALGTVGGADFYYFRAEKIGALKIGATTIPLTPGNDSLVIGATGDLFAVDLF